jgi:RNA polymerase sigma-70 factor (sigma-E family)
VPDPRRDSFEEYVAARREALLRTAYLLTGHHHDAEDLVQVALIKVVPKWSRIADNPEPYVRKVLVRENISRWRRRRWRERHFARLPDIAVSGPSEHRVALNDALAKLAPRQRAVIVLRYYDDLTEHQAAQMLGVSVGTVKSQARDGLARLRGLLDDTMNH